MSAGSASLAAERRTPLADRPADSLVILVHGYGADGNDLIALADALAPRLATTAFAAPHAPFACAAAPAGREWFPLTFRDPAEYVAGVTAAWPGLAGFVRAEAAALGLPEGRVALVGFSQGTMMALAVALSGAVRPACLVGFSGRLAVPDGLAAPGASPVPALLVHGAEDPVIPAGETVAAAERLAALGWPVEWHVEPGLGHAVSPTGLDRAATYLANLFQP